MGQLAELRFWSIEKMASPRVQPIFRLSALFEKAPFFRPTSSDSCLSVQIL
jgi:hypothetical protein